MTVFPEYSDEIRKPLSQALELCDEAKASKDVESDDMGQQYYVMYKDALGLLDAVLSDLTDCLPELATVDAGKRRDYERQRNLAIILAVVGAGAGIVATLLALWLGT